MDFEITYNIFAEAKAILEMKSPLRTFKPEDIGTFVLAWSGVDAITAVRGTLIGFGCDERGEYAMIKPWAHDTAARFELVARLPADLMPTKTVETEETIRRDPNVNLPGRPL